VKHLTYKETRIRKTLDIIPEISQARRQWSGMFKLLKEKTFF
jgi:hypothetical protein